MSIILIIPKTSFNISSMMGLISQPGKAVYSAAESGIIGLSKGVALEGDPFGVTCNAICPGYAYPAVTDPQVRAFQEKEGLAKEMKIKKKTMHLDLCIFMNK